MLVKQGMKKITLGYDTILPIIVNNYILHNIYIDGH